jgi:hypothetical protein
VDSHIAQASSMHACMHHIGPWSLTASEAMASNRQNVIIDKTHHFSSSSSYVVTPIDPACFCMVHTLQDGLYQGSHNHLIFVSIELGLLAPMMPLWHQKELCHL